MLHPFTLIARNNKGWIAGAAGVAERFKIRLVLLCQIMHKLVIPARKRVSSAMDGKLKPFHGAWIPAIPE